MASITSFSVLGGWKQRSGSEPATVRPMKIMPCAGWSNRIEGAQFLNNLGMSRPSLQLRLLQKRNSSLI